MDESFRSITAAQISEVARTHARLLYRVAYGIVRSPAVAEDVCQDALVKLVKSPDQVRDWAAARAWLVRAVTNGALQHLRRSKVERRSVQYKLEQAKQLDDVGDDDFLLREKLLERLDQLDEDLRDVVVLRVMQGHSGVEVQRLLGLSAVDVSRRLHAGLNRLRVALREPADRLVATPKADL